MQIEGHVVCQHFWLYMYYFPGLWNPTKVHSVALDSIGWTLQKWYQMLCLSNVIPGALIADGIFHYVNLCLIYSYFRGVSDYWYLQFCFPIPRIFHSAWRWSTRGRIFISLGLLSCSYFVPTDNIGSCDCDIGIILRQIHCSGYRNDIDWILIKIESGQWTVPAGIVLKLYQWMWPSY